MLNGTSLLTLMLVRTSIVDVWVKMNRYESSQTLVDLVAERLPQTLVELVMDVFRRHHEEEFKRLS